VIEAVRASGGGVVSADVPDCPSRTALVSDPDGRSIELIGPTMEH
jgi:predicted enzyme related to lactoylglutathione lyase